MNTEALMKQLGIDKEHKGKIEEVTKYLEDNRIQELFNVSTAAISCSIEGQKTKSSGV
jgi:hypothetical protein